MKQLFLGRVSRIAVFIIPLSVLIGCALPSSPSPTSSPAVVPRNYPNLTVIQIPVRLWRVNNPETMLQQDQTVPIQVNDGITVDEAGRGVLRIADRVVVDIFRGTELSLISLTDVPTELGNPIFVRMKESHGHTRVALSEAANARVRLETDFATITSLREGTEFLTCHDPTLLTCLVVTKGEVEVEGQGKVVTVRGGESTYILKGQAPLPPICEKPDEVNAWIDKELGTEKVDPLGALVAGWPNQPCNPLPTPTSPPLPPSSPPLPPSEGMVKIGAGLYTIGITPPDDFHIATQAKKLNDFWIDEYLVANAQYKKFIDATGHLPPVGWPGKEKNPVAGVTWDDAAAYCAFVHKRLPTEAEWEVAARGPGPNPALFPWGNDSQAGGKINDLPLTDTYEVGSLPFNKSSFGVYDMVGNVWEWVGEPYAPVTEGMKVLRGGRYGFIKDAAFRQQAEPKSKSFVPFAGFRCVADRVGG